MNFTEGEIESTKPTFCRLCFGSKPCLFTQKRALAVFEEFARSSEHVGAFGDPALA